MSETALAQFIRQTTTPEMLEIEMARRAIIEKLSEQGTNYVDVQFLISAVRQKLGFGRGPVFEGDDSITPDLNETKARVAALEAVQLLHASGAIIGAGQPPYQNDEVYLSSIDESLLSSRAKRCLQEAIDAFRHGLYLSACMNVGAASESLWMELGRLVHQKVMATKELTDALTKNAVIAKVIDATWNALNHHAKATLNSIIPFDVDQRLFKEKADRLRDRRNYAMHSDAADVDEPLFTYNETGILLLDAADYFNKLARLIAAFS